MTGTPPQAPRPQAPGPQVPRPQAPRLPALVPGVVRHARPGAKGHAFSHRGYQWLIDVEHHPRVPRGLGWAAGIRSRDHLGDPHRCIKDNVIEFVRQAGGPADEIDRVLMLANARVAGYVFNPLSVHWCLRRDGTEAAVVAEVHNTYGERHAYLLLPDEQGRSTVDKAFYVSPFNDVSGRYHLRTTLRPDAVRVQIALSGDDAPRFSASFTGTPEPYTPTRLARAILRHPLMTLQVSAAIRAHGIWLWARGHRVVRRPQHRPPLGV